MALNCHFAILLALTDQLLIMILTLIVALAFVNSVVESKFHIVGGEDAQPHQHPHILSLQRWVGHTSCGGSLLALRPGDTSSNIGITAAHCMCGDTALEEREGQKAIAGKYYVDEEPETEEMETREIVVQKCHPNWDRKSSGAHDVAVIKFSSPFQFTDTIKGIELVSAFDEEHPGKECTVAGWGGIDEYDRTVGERAGLPSVLQEMQIHVQPASICEELFATPGFFHADTMICAKPNDKLATPCVGDSGGPLTCKDENGRQKLHGVVSFGAQGCSREYPAVFTRLRSFMPWIQKMIEELSTS